MTQRTVSNKAGKYILVFNNTKRFIAVYKSCTATANTFNTTATNIHFACTGKSISACNHYFRYCDKEKLDFEKIQNMSVIDWDKSNGLKREYYSNGKMSRLGRKYNKEPKENKAVQSYFTLQTTKCT